MASSDPWLLYYGSHLLSPKKLDATTYVLFAQRNSYIPQGCFARLDLKCMLINKGCKSITIDFPSLENNWARCWMKQRECLNKNEITFDSVLIDNTRWEAKPFIVREGDPIVIVSFSN